jgi:hypothetical protein
MTEATHDYRSNDFDLPQNQRYEKRALTIKRIGQVIVFGLILAGLSGVLGKGIWTRKSVDISNGFLMEYESLPRAKSESPLVIYCTPEDTMSELRVAIAVNYLKWVSLREVYPEPRSVEMGRDSLIYRFSLNKKNGTGTIRFSTYPNKAGRVDLGIGVMNKQTVVSQFIYP